MNSQSSAVTAESFAEVPSTTGNARDLLAECIRLDQEKREAKATLDVIEEQLKDIKEKVKDLFIEMGVKSMKADRKTVYISKEFWAGIGPDVEKDALADALVEADMADYITCNSQKLSSYVRETAKSHPELVGPDGEITASPEEIIAILPEPFNTMFKVTERVDIRIRK